MYYKLYAQTQQGSWEKVSTNDNLEKLRQGIKKLELTGYFAYMIVKNNNQGDEVIERDRFQEDTKPRKNEKEKVKDFKSKYKVQDTDNPITNISTSRAKQKEDLRKLTDEYLK